MREADRAVPTDCGVSRDIPPSLRGELLALNNAHAEELSLLDAAGLEALLAGAFHAGRVGALDAALIALDETHPTYDSPNYLWFRARYPRFVYVDRVVVAEGGRRRGLARRLYDDLIGCAAEAGHARLVCEVNADPPNPVSDAFHAALGFEAVGSASIRGGSKTVRYLALDLTRGN